MDEARTFGYCENCGEKITDRADEYYVDSEGRVYCSVECVLEAHDVTVMEV